MFKGFTPLAEKLAKLGSRGVEQLTTVLNEYFGQIINLIHNHGGDIVKFAGDALLAIWPSINGNNKIRHIQSNKSTTKSTIITQPLQKHHTFFVLKHLLCSICSFVLFCFSF
jgi:hypothetical protein